jgi:hypothetical protein
LGEDGDFRASLFDIKKVELIKNWVLSAVLPPLSSILIR